MTIQATSRACAPPTAQCTPPQPPALAVARAARSRVGTRMTSVTHAAGSRLGLALVDTVLLFGHATGAVLMGVGSAVRLTVGCATRVLPM